MAEASRELFWNIPLGPWIVYPLAAIAVIIFAWASYRRYRLIAIGKRGVPMGSWSQRIVNFIGVGIVDGFLHKRIFRDAYPGLMHFFIFWGCLVFLIATAAETINKYVFHYLYGPTYLVVSAYVDIIGLLALVGIAIAAWRRYIQRPKRLDNKPEDAIALILIAVIVISGYLVEGLRFASPDPGKDAAYAYWSTGGWVFSLFISLIGINPPLAVALHPWAWGFHVLLSIGAVIYVSVTFSRFTHILMSPINVFLRPFKPRGQLDSFDIEKAIEKGEPLGANQIHHFNWKHLLDTDGCTRCGRCQDQCPANFTGKPLSPKKIVQDLRTELNINGPKVRAAMDKAAGVVKKAKPAPATEGQAPAEAATPEPINAPTIIGSRISEDEIWSCTTCAACLEACPAFIDPLGKIVEMRRNLVLEQTKMPETAQTILKCIEDRGHSCRGTLFSRTDWYSGLSIKALADDSRADILYWTGCAASLEDRSIKVATAFAKVARASGVKLGVLGAEESCCGDPARRMGNEYLFQMLAMKNIETLKTHGVKTIVTTCPHCFNTLKNEYPQFGGDFYEVVSHTEFIGRLIDESRLKLTGEVDKKLTYHDSCYLGRHNGIYLPPRHVLGTIPKAQLVEMKRRNQKGFCCGGGGGRFWMEERIGKRISEERIEEAIGTGADLVATACPYCLQMFEDAIKAKGAEEKFRARDIAELVAEALPK